MMRDSTDSKNDVSFFILIIVYQGQVGTKLELVMDCSNLFVYRDPSYIFITLGYCQWTNTELVASRDGGGVWSLTLYSSLVKLLIHRTPDIITVIPPASSGESSGIHC